MLQGKIKTDWNDIHLSLGIAEIQKQLIGKDIGVVSSTRINSIEIPEKITSIVQMRSMKLNDSQITSIKKNTLIVEKSHDINQLVAANNRNNQTIEKTDSFATNRSLSIKINREIDLEL